MSAASPDAGDLPSIPVNWPDLCDRRRLIGYARALAPLAKARTLGHREIDHE